MVDEIVRDMQQTIGGGEHQAVAGGEHQAAAGGENTNQQILFDIDPFRQHLSTGGQVRKTVSWYGVSIVIQRWR
ncbi:hypothetical protein RJT34_11747 [Clitoria ternatea]|uniref:Uncharacterized protein n=1 Tax=Clitoria ternatea TaxID=43366 RepID=A0AAN9JME6_CLITE